MRIALTIVTSVAAWLIGLTALASALADMAWARDAAARWIAPLAGADAAAVFGVVIEGWRAVTMPLDGLLNQAFNSPMPRAATDGVILAALFVAALVRGLTMQSDSASFRAAVRESAMESRLRGRLPALYREIDGLDGRAGDRGAVRRDAEMLAPWAAKMAEFLQTKEDPDEIELDKAWLENAIVQNVTFEFDGGDMGDHSRWTAAIAQSIVRDTVAFADRAHRSRGAGPRYFGRVARRAIAAALVLGGAYGVELASSLAAG